VKTIIAGSRSITDYELLLKAIKESEFEISEVVCGLCEGVDSLGEQWAKNNKIDRAYYPADWEKHGRAAGMIRNIEMAKYADALIAVWDGSSPGTENMVKLAIKMKLQYHVYNMKGLKI